MLGCEAEELAGGWWGEDWEFFSGPGEQFQGSKQGKGQMLKEWASGAS